MTPRQRFGVWILAAVVALAAPLWLHVPAPRPAFLAAAGGVAGLSLILLLLASTPPDAIRLPPWASVAAVGAGAALLPALTSAPPRVIAALGAAGVLLAAISSAPKVRLTPHFPWALTLLLWHPSLWLMPLLRLDERLGSTLFWFGPMFVSWTVGAITRFASGTSDRRNGRFLLLGWAFGALMILVPAWRFGV